MTEPCRHEVYGSHFEVDGDEPLASELLESMRDVRVGEPASDTTNPPLAHRLCVRIRTDVWTVSWDDHDRYCGPELDLALYDSLIAVNIHAARVAAEAGDTVLHGGAVTVNGRAVAFVGHSGAGKSTFTTAMTLAGHPYLADEVVAIGDDAVVRTFHRPIGLRQGGADAIGIQLPEGPYAHIHPYRVGVHHQLGVATPLALVLLLVRDDEPSPWLERLRPATALFHLANQTLGAIGLEREMFHRLEVLVRTVPVCRLHYANFTDARALVEDILADDVSTTLNLPTVAP